MTIELKKDEYLLIEKLRSCAKYATLTVEKRPSAEYPDGEISRIVVEQSFLVREMRLLPPNPLDII